MPKRKRVILYRLDFRTGGFDTKTKKRLPDIPRGIYNSKKEIFPKRKTVSLREYNKLLERYKNVQPKSK